MRLRRHVLPAVALAMSAAAPATASAACRNTRITPASTAGTVTAARQATLCLVNLQRRHHGLPRLAENPLLQRAASAYSRTMVAHRFFDHVGPDGSTLQQRIATVGYSPWTELGENIAWGSGSLATPRQIVNGWMHSPGHRANILDAAFRQIGVGVAAGAPLSGILASAAVYTTDFATPR